MLGKHFAGEIAAFGLALLFTCAPAWGANKTYTGDAGQGTWSVGSLWSPVGAPQNGDNCFLTPTDANNRTVVFGGTGVGVFSYGAVTVRSSGTGSIVLLNNATFPFTAQFPAQSLTIADRGVYRQNPGTTSTIVSTVISGGPNFSTAGLLHNEGTYFATDVAQTGGVVFGGGAYIISNRYSFQGGRIGPFFFPGPPPPRVTNNGTFEQSGNAALDCTFINNGTFICNGGFASDTEMQNHGAIIANADVLVGTLDNFVSMSVPAGPSFASVGGITQSGGTLTHANTVTGPVRVAGGTWHVLGGLLERREIPTGTNSSIISGTLTIGAAGSAGTFLLSNGTVTMQPIQIGAAASSGTFLQSGGVVTTDEPISVGARPENFAPGGRGHYSISGGGVTAPSLIVGAADALAGTFAQSGGAVTVGSLTVNENSASGGTVMISGGSFGSTLGAANHGALVQTGGTSSFRRIDGAGSLQVGGTGLMAAQHGIRQGSVHLGANGRLTTSQTAPTPTNRVRSLSFEEVGPAVQGTWDLGQGALVVDYAGPSPIADIRRFLRSGYAGGSWTGTGLTSSAAQSSPGTTALGYGEAGLLLGPAGGDFQGVLVDGDAVLVRPTRVGDADLNGVVNLGDFNRLAANFGSTDGTWLHGDFNYDGIVNLQDFNRLAANFGLSAAGPGVTAEDWAALAAAVPEPCAALPAVLAGLLAARRRSRGRPGTVTAPAA